MIIDRAFIQEVIRTMLAVTLVVISIFMVVRVMGFLSQAADGVIPVDSVLTLLMLKMVVYLDVMLPLMFYIALLMVLSRWYRDHEMATLSSVGLGISHFLKPMAWLVLGLGGLVVFFAFYLTPLSAQKGYVLEKQLKANNEVSGVLTGKFVEVKGGKGVYFVERYNKKTQRYENVFVYLASFKRDGVVVAKQAFLSEDQRTQDHFLVLLNGTRYEGKAGTTDYRVIEFEKYAVRIEPKTRKATYLPLRARTNSVLRQSTDATEKSEWYWRIAKSLTLPVLALFALALCYVDNRRGKSKGLVLAFVVYLSYTNLLGYAVALIKEGQFRNGAPVWLVHFVYAILAIYCFYRRNQNLPLIPSINSVFKR